MPDFSYSFIIKLHLKKYKKTYLFWVGVSCFKKGYSIVSNGFISMFVKKKDDTPNISELQNFTKQGVSLLMYRF